MDCPKLRSDYPAAYKNLAHHCWDKKAIDLERLSLRFSAIDIQKYFADQSIYIEIQWRNGWKPKVGHIESDYFYEDILNAYEFAIETALGLLEARLKGSVEKDVDGKELHNQLIEFMPEKQKKSYNVFSSTLRSLRLNKVKSVIFVEGFDWVKTDSEIYYKESGVKKIKEYLTKLKITE